MMTLEKEFTIRAMTHKMSILGGVIMLAYKQRELSKGGVQLPEHVILEQADKYSEKVMKNAMANGTFNKMYEDAWNSIVNTMPEHMNCMEAEA